MVPNFASYERAPAGLFWGLFAGFCWAIGTFIVKRTAWPGMGLSLTFWQIVISLPPILLGALAIDGIPDHWPSTGALIATIYTGAIPMALGTATWFALVKLLPAQIAALSSIAIPIVAIVSGVLLLHEPLSPLQTVAIASTVVALWLALMPGKKRCVLAELEAADAVEARIVEVGIGAGVHARRLERRFQPGLVGEGDGGLVDVRHVDRYGLGAHLLGQRRYQCGGRVSRLGEQRPDARGGRQVRMTAKPTILPSRNATSEARSGREIHAARNESRASGKKRRS